MEKSTGFFRTHGAEDGVKVGDSSNFRLLMKRMRRGVDESNIESMGEASEPYVIQKFGKGASLVQKGGFMGMKKRRNPTISYK
jgi:hypothetical protein